jgi:hypothetical protein
VVKFELQPAFAQEMAWILFGREASSQIRATRKHDAPELLHAAHLTDYGIAHLGGSGGEIGFIERTAEQRSGRERDFLCVRSLLQTPNQRRKQQT